MCERHKKYRARHHGARMAPLGDDPVASCTIEALERFVLFWWFGGDSPRELILLVLVRNRQFGC